MEVWISSVLPVGKLEVLRCLDSRPLLLKRRVRAALIGSASKLGCLVHSTRLYCTYSKQK